MQMTTISASKQHLAVYNMLAFISPPAMGWLQGGPQGFLPPGGHTPILLSLPLVGQYDL